MVGAMLVGDDQNEIRVPVHRPPRAFEQFVYHNPAVM
jgi:hypothetical protein